MSSAAWILVAVAAVSPLIVDCAFPYAKNAQGQRIYMIQVGHDYGAYEYIGSDGVLDGFFHDLITAVCGEMGMDCRTVWDPYANCVGSGEGSHLRGGPGLMDKWYDGCVGWSVTVQRSLIFTFSESFLKGQVTTFYVKADDTSFNTNDFKDKTIVFLDGWAGDEKCLARTTGVVLDKSKIKYVKSIEEFVNAITSGQADAGHAGDHYMEKYVTGNNPSLKKVGDKRNCVLRGNAMMARKDNSEFIAMWNDGFSKLVSDGRFQKLCEEAKTKHTKGGGKIECV